MNRQLLSRADKAINHAFDILINDSFIDAISEELKANTANAVRFRIDDKYIVRESGYIIVTEIGFVTMALFTGNAIYKNNFLIIPGVDEKKQFGHLVLRNDFVPYHSLAQDIDGAVDETTAAHERSAELLKYFGDKPTLQQVAKAAPWYQISTNDDVINAGMCQWGTTSFLRRTKVCFIARRFGLPRFLVRLSGSYGDRITAATTRRIEEKLNANRTVTLQAKTRKGNHA